jgi:hypothetical protein
MKAGSAQRIERAVILSLFPAVGWTAAAVFVLAVSWDGSLGILVATFWLGVTVGVVAGNAVGVIQSWRTRHRAGAITAAWWLGASPLVLLGVLSIISPWTYLLGLGLLACLVFGLALGLPAGFAVAALVRRIMRPHHGRAPWPHE